MKTQLLLTAYGNSPAPYPMVPSPTPFDLHFSHNTFVTDDNRQKDDDDDRRQSD